MKNISTGNWITIAVVAVNVIFMVAVMSKDVEVVKGDVIKVTKVANTAREMAYTNERKIAVVESKIDQGFANLEKLIIKTNGY